MNGVVTHGTLLISDLCLVVEAGCLWRQLFGYSSMAFETELTDRCTFQHFWVARSMWNVASGAALELCRCMFESEWPLLAAMAFDACYVGTDRELGLLRFKTAVSVVTIAALHRTFKDFVVEWFGELRLRLAVAFNTKLRLTDLEQLIIGLFFDQGHRSVFRNRLCTGVSGVTIIASNVIAPMFPTTEIIM